MNGLLRTDGGPERKNKNNRIHTQKTFRAPYKTVLKTKETSVCYLFLAEMLVRHFFASGI